MDIEPVRTFIRREFLYDPDAPLGPDDTLFPEVVDSLGVMELVDFLEETYGIEVGDQEMLVSNFASLNAVAELVERKQAA